MDAKELESKLDEIERLQSEVSAILYSKNPFVRWLKLGKAVKLHKKADSLLRELIQRG